MTFFFSSRSSIPFSVLCKASFVACSAALLVISGSSSFAQAQVNNFPFERRAHEFLFAYKLRCVCVWEISMYQIKSYDMAWYQMKSNNDICLWLPCCLVSLLLRRLKDTAYTRFFTYTVRIEFERTLARAIAEAAAYLLQHSCDLYNSMFLIFRSLSFRMSVKRMMIGLVLT